MFECIVDYGWGKDPQLSLGAFVGGPVGGNVGVWVRSVCSDVLDSADEGLDWAGGEAGDIMVDNIVSNTIFLVLNGQGCRCTALL